VGLAVTRQREDLRKVSFRAALRARAEEGRRGLAAHPSLAALIAYHRRRSLPGEEEDLRDHLTLCPECRELVLDLVHFGETAAAAPTDEQVEAAWQVLRIQLGGARPG